MSAIQRKRTLDSDIRNSKMSLLDIDAERR